MKLKDMFFKDQCPICNGKIPLKDGCHYFNDFHSYFYELFYINIVKFGIYEFMIDNYTPITDNYKRIGESEIIIQFSYDRPYEYGDGVKYGYSYNIRNIIKEENLFTGTISEDFDFTDESVSNLIKRVLNNLIFI